MDVHQESNQKYTFVTPEGKPGAVPVHSLIAREKPGSESPKVTFLKYCLRFYGNKPDILILELIFILLL